MTSRAARLALFALIALFAFGVNAALADDPAQVPAPAAGENGEPGFWASLMKMILSFNSRGLMELLGRPQFAIPAFIAINLIVFVETGLLIGFFLPGDSLLVTVGLIASNPACNWSLPLLLLTITASAIIGDTIGYSIGYKTGPMIFSREKSFFFKRDHLLAAQAFYEKHGGKTIILARFMPILRTFAPVVAGVGKMDYKRFLAFNVIGGFGWVWSMILIGYYLPSLINPTLKRIFNRDILIQDHVEKVVVVVVFLSIAPGLIVWLKSRLSNPSKAPRDEMTIAV